MTKVPAHKNVKLPPVFRALMDPGVYGPEYGFRPGTKQQRYVINFALNAGGLGDYINYSVAILWAAKHCPWIEGKVFVSEYMVPLMKLIFKDHPDWEVFPGERAGEFIDPQTPLIGPEIEMEGRNVNPQLLNATGAHLIDLGFAYYLNTCPAPKEAWLPMLDIPASKLPLEVKKLHGKYVVIPTGSMTPSRWIEGKHLNPLIRHVKSLGLTPVFLGKKDVTKGLSAYFADDIAYSEGLDLRDKTTILDAACILQNSIATMGLDCGLLHLAAITKDSKVVFGYNIVEPKDREPRRNWGRTINIALTKEELPCSGCQTNMRLLIAHTFHTCVYNDTKCIDLLFGNDCEKWKVALNQIMGSTCDAV